MQQRLAIAALVGAVSAKDLQKIQNVLVQAAEEALEDAQYMLDELDETPEPELELAVFPERSSVDVKKIEDIVGGILKGALDAEGFSDINSCIADAETIF